MDIFSNRAGIINTRYISIIYNPLLVFEPDSMQLT